jgi:xylulose-5-phosphate/fructose-6-phosphate phosphoketolase
VVVCLPQAGSAGAHLQQRARDSLVRHTLHIAATGVDMPEIRDWPWSPWTR